MCRCSCGFVFKTMHFVLKMMKSAFVAAAVGERGATCGVDWGDDVGGAMATLAAACSCDGVLAAMQEE